MKPILATYWRSSCSFRVRIALGYKKVAYEPLLVNLLEGEQNKPAHRAKNPIGQVPTLTIDGVTHVDSIAIMELLEEIYPEPPLLPKAPHDRARVRALVRRNTRDRPTVLQIGDLRLDPATHRAWRGAAALDLSPKEMSLLELLMRHPDEVITRTRILEHVWDFAYDGLSNVVDQYVSYLRKKVDKPFDRDDIETVRGVGYRLRIPEP